MSLNNKAGLVPTSDGGAGPGVAPGQEAVSARSWA